LTWKQFWALGSTPDRRNNMNNLVALTAMVSSNATMVLWIVAAVLLVLYVVRRHSRKDKGQDPLR